MGRGNSTGSYRKSVKTLLEAINGLLEQPENDPGITSSAHEALEKLLTLREDFHSGRLTVAMLALAKSGKSTFLNAILGANVLPSNNIPETARICCLSHDPFTEHRTATLSTNDEVLAKGGPAICDKLRQLNEEVRGSREVSNLEEVLTVKLAIPALQNLPEYGYPIEFLDTPGPNEAGVPQLREKIVRILGQTDVIIYLLDYTKLKTEDEASLFRTMREINPQLLQRLATRLFFVVNKIDEAPKPGLKNSITGGLSMAETKEYVAGLVTEQMSAMNVPGFKLDPDMVYCVSSKRALMSRLILHGDPTDDTKIQFCQIQYGEDREFDEVTDEEYESAAKRLLDKSGLKQLEERLLSFLHVKGETVKLLAIADNCDNILNHLCNQLVYYNGLLQKEFAEMQSLVEEKKRKLADALKQFQLVQGDVDGVTDKLQKKVEDRLEALRVTCKDKVNYVVLPNNELNDQGPFSGWWKDVKSEVQQGMRSCKDDKEYWAKLPTWVEKVHGVLSAELAECQRQVAIDANDLQDELFKVLNDQIATVAKTMGEVLQDNLDVRLRPVELKLERPTEDELHNKVKEVAENKDTIWKRVGKWFSRCVGLGRNLLEKLRSRKNEELAKQWGQVIDDYVEQQKSKVVEELRSSIGQDLAAAHATVSSYADRYTAVMNQALEQSAKGEETRKQALESVGNWMKQLLNFGNKIQDLKAELSGDLERSEDAIIETEQGTTSNGHEEFFVGLMQQYGRQ